MEETNDVLLGHLRNELRKGNIKLWEEPYTDLSGSATDDMRILATTLSLKLKLPQEQVAHGLEHLRSYALEKQQRNLRFKVENVATLRLKFSSKIISKKITSIETRLDITGEQLHDLISLKLDLTSDLLKLVYAGKIIDKKKTLIEQGVQHNKTIMCLHFSLEGKQQASQVEKEMQEVRKARRGAELLATSSTSVVQNYEAQITDQNGRSIDLPNEERVSLMIALGLHEKGRAVLRSEKYNFALLFLLEAESEFSRCRSDILNQVDNFAVLHLDISWCYLHLENLDALPDAGKRLQMCENCFKQSYGESLQRLLAVKGSVGHEIALFVRLYVLQGVVAFYEAKFTAARDLFAKAKFYADSIQVDSDKVTEMVKVGFSVSEARLALRACEGNLLAATRQAFIKREEKERIQKEEKEKLRKRKLARSFGKCKNGQDVNVDIYEKMVNELGFDSRLASESLKVANNDLHNAMQLIHDNPESLKQAKKEVSQTLIQQVSYIFDSGLVFLSVKSAVPKLCAARLCQGRRESMRKLLYLLLFSQ